MVTTETLPAAAVVVTAGAAFAVVVAAAAPTLLLTSVILLFTPTVTAAEPLSAPQTGSTGITPAQRAHDSTDAISLFALILFSFYFFVLRTFYPFAIIHYMMRTVICMIVQIRLIIITHHRNK